MKILLQTWFLFLIYITAEAQTTLILQPDSAHGKDMIVNSYYPTGPNGYAPEFDAIAWTHSGSLETVRGYIQFDLSSIPPGSIVQSAYLTLFYNPGSVNATGSHSHQSGSNAAWLQRVITTWNDVTICWNNQPQTTTIHQAILPADTASNENYIIAVDSLVQDMIDNPSTSFGFMLRLQDETHYRALLFASSDHPDSTIHPKLEITYSPNVGIPPVADQFDQLKVFPNPANHELTLQGSSRISQVMAVSVKNILGENVLSKKTNWNGAETINLESLSNGIYFISMQSENVSVTRKFVKE